MTSGRQRDVAVYLEWIRTEVPQLALRSEDYQKQVITFAIEHTRGTQFWLAVFFFVATVLLAFRLMQELGIDRTGRLLHAVAMALASAVFSAVLSVAGRVLIRRRIREFAEPAT